MPEMTTERVEMIAERYRELYEKITGEAFDRSAESLTKEEIEGRTADYLKTL